MSKTKLIQYPIACKNKPRQCKCDPVIWDGWWKVCPKFVENKDFSDGRCKVCEHEKPCHSNGTARRGASSELSCSDHQSGAGGALRCAVFAIEDACRQLDWHYQAMKRPRDEYVARMEELSRLRIAACDALNPIWKLCGNRDGKRS